MNPSFVFPARLWTRAALWLASVAIVAMACSADDRAAPANTDGVANKGDIVFGACSGGAQRDCSITLGQNGDVLSCFHGQQLCIDGTWSECSAGSVFTYSANALALSAQAMTFSDAEDCEANPCDPSCQAFDETPDGDEDFELPGGEPLFTWTAGSLSSLPGGLVNKGIKEPCQSASDCQFNRQCVGPVTGPGCGHSKCAVGAGLDASCDPCVAEICADDPSCCSTVYDHSCEHDPCSTGAALKSNCDDCVKKVCDDRSSCCSKKFGSWDATCVALMKSECGLECPLGAEGEWTQSCVDKVDTLCGAACGEPIPTSCAHNACSTGDALDAGCNTCVGQICKADPYCCSVEWDSICVNAVDSVCDEECPLNMDGYPEESGECSAWLPGETDSNCSGIDLAVDVPCDEVIPVCNHGTEEAPAGIRLIHYPANSQQYPKCSPDQSHPQMYECFTEEPIPPGHCINVTGCSQLTGNREILVNPPGDDHVDECSCQDNWSLYSGGSCEAPICSGVQREVAFKQVNLYFMFDRSGSMAGSKWTGSTKAMKRFFASPGSAGLNAALEFFPLGASASTGDGCGAGADICEPEPCSNPLVPSGPLLEETGSDDPQETALIAAIDSTYPNGMTPTHPALGGALQWGVEGITDNPDDFYAVVLVTDGAPTQCDRSTTSIAGLAVNAYVDYGVKTYTIGMEGAVISALNSIAQAGGTGSAFVIKGTTQVEEQLIEALQAIAQENSPCQFEIVNSENVSPASAELIVTPSGGGDPVEIERVNRASDCGEGWYYDDNDNPSSARLCLQTCNDVLDDPGAQVDLTVGCKTKPATTTTSRIYEASCPETQGPQWGFLTYDADTSGSGSVRFRGRTATSEEGLADAEWVDLAVAQSEPEDTQDCTESGPDGCPINLYGELGATPAATYPLLELEIVLTASGGGAAALNDWKVTYSCVDNQ